MYFSKNKNTVPARIQLRRALCFCFLKNDCLKVTFWFFLRRKFAFLGHALGGGLNRWCVAEWVTDSVCLSNFLWNFSKTVYKRTSYNCLIYSLQESFSKLNFSGFRRPNRLKFFSWLRVCLLYVGVNMPRAPRARGHVHVPFYEGTCPKK